MKHTRLVFALIVMVTGCGTQDGFRADRQGDSGGSTSSSSTTPPPPSAPPPVVVTPPPPSTPPPVVVTPPPPSTPPPVVVPPPSTTVSTPNVMDRAGLLAALASGANLILAPGAYGALTITGKTGVTISSANPANPARFDSINISGGDHITLKGIKVLLAINSTSQDWAAAVAITNAKNVSLSGCDVANSLASDGGAYDGYSKGYPIYARNSSDVMISNCRISGGHRAVMFTDSDRVSAMNNQISGFRAVGVASGGCNSLRIIGNYMTDANPYKWPVVDHGDFIHIWTDQARGPADDIQIADNWLDQGAGVPIMGPSIQNTGGHYFTNVVITNNLIHTANNQALRMDGVHSFNVSGNSMISTAPIGTQIINIGGTQVTVNVGNAAVIFTGAQTGVFDKNIWGKLARTAVGVTVGNNLSVLFSNQAKVFTNPQGSTWADYIALPNGPGAGLGIR